MGVRVYSPTVGLYPFGNPVLTYAGAMPDADDLQVRLSPNPQTGRDFEGSNRDIARASFIAKWSPPRGTVTSWTGYTDADFSFDEDGDFDAEFVNGRDVALRAARFDYSSATEQLSQELRYESDLDGPVNFAVGGLYWNDDTDQTQRSINTFCLPPIPPNVLFPGQPPLPASCGTLSANEVLGRLTAIPRPTGREIDHKSIYGLLSFEFGGIWKFTAEARYSDEKETVLGVNCALPATPAFPGGPLVPCNDPTFPGQPVFGPSVNLLFDFTRQAPGAPVTIESSEEFTTPRFTLEAKARENLLLYGVVAKGIKPGGVSTVTAGAWQDADFDGRYDEVTYKRERVISYELGAKSEWLNGRLRLNGDVFFVDYEDKQTGAQLVTPSGIATGRILNAGDAEVRGVELDVDWALTDHFLAHLNYTYLDTEVKDFPFDSNSATDAVRTNSCIRTAATQYRLCSHNLAGNELEDAPSIPSCSSAATRARSRAFSGAVRGGTSRPTGRSRASVTRRSSTAARSTIT
jgi:outer membrane receptor protein involved in Fe transport